MGDGAAAVAVEGTVMPATAGPDPVGIGALPAACSGCVFWLRGGSESGAGPEVLRPPNGVYRVLPGRHMSQGRLS